MSWKGLFWHMNKYQMPRLIKLPFYYIHLLFVFIVLLPFFWMLLSIPITLCFLLCGKRESDKLIIEIKNAISMKEVRKDIAKEWKLYKGQTKPN